MYTRFLAIFDCSFEWELRTPNLGEGRPWGSGCYCSKSVGEAVHSNISYIFTSFRYIAVFVLHHAIFSYPPLFSPKFLHVPVGVGGSPFGYKERSCWANCPAISFQDFQPMCSQYTNVTDRQTDRQTDDMRSQDRALH